ncbi:MAG: hypothetical protein M3Y07_02090 [Acidobacteriota bacterium]|nr:hypothetical protein [Acidobacteriota bacterium]
MARGKAGQNSISVEDLEMALVGYRMKQQELEERIREMRGHGDGRGAAGATRAKEESESGPKNGRKRTLSASARKRIAIAQKKRWAEHRKKMSQPAKAE